jgi:hypothetical protein
MILHGSVKQCKKCDFYLRRFKKMKNISIQGWGGPQFLISLEPCALNAEFQYFIPRSNKFPYFMDTPERKKGLE